LLADVNNRAHVIKFFAILLSHATHPVLLGSKALTSEQGEAVESSKVVQAVTANYLKLSEIALDASKDSCFCRQQRSTKRAT